METSSQHPNLLVRTYRFYRDGFRNLSPMSRKLWLIIIIKLFIMFAVLRVFFFPNYVKEQAKERNIDRQEVVGDELLDRRAPGSTSPSTAGK